MGIHNSDVLLCGAVPLQKIDKPLLVGLVDRSREETGQILKQIVLLITREPRIEHHMKLVGPRPPLHHVTKDCSAVQGVVEDVIHLHVKDKGPLCCLEGRSVHQKPIWVGLPGDIALWAVELVASEGIHRLVHDELSPWFDGVFPGLAQDLRELTKVHVEASHDGGVPLLGHWKLWMVRVRRIKLLFQRTEPSALEEDELKAENDQDLLGSHWSLEIAGCVLSADFLRTHLGFQGFGGLGGD